MTHRTVQLLVSGLIVFLAVIASAATVRIATERAQPARIFEVEMRSQIGSKADLLYDTGNGFNAVSSQFILGDDKFHTLYFPLPSKRIVKLRFDPLDGAGTVTMKNPVFRDARSGVETLVALSQFAPLAQIESFTLSGSGEIAIVTAPNATDPMLSFELTSPLEGGFEPLDLVRSAVPWAFAASMIFVITGALARRTLSLTALAVSIVSAAVLTPEIFERFSTPSMEGTIRLRSPGASVARLQFCSADSVCSHQTSVNLEPAPRGSVRWNFEVHALGKKNARSLDSQVRIGEISTPEMRLETWNDVGGTENWKQFLTMGRVGPEGKLAVTSAEARVHGSLEGESLTIMLLGGKAGGLAEVTVNGRTEPVDLYSELPEEYFFLTFENLRPAGDQPLERSFHVPRLPFSSVRVSTDQAAGAEILDLTIPPYSFRQQSVGEYEATLSSTRIAVQTLLSVIASSLLIFLVVREGQRVWIGSGNLVLFHRLFSTLLAAFTWAVFWPGLFDSDAVRQWTAGAEGEYYTWHPPAFSMLMGAVQWISSTPGPMCFAGAFLLTHSLFAVLRSLSISSRGCLALSVFIPMIPPLWKYFGSVTNSVWAAAAFFYCIWWALRARDSNRLLHFCASGAFLLAAVLCRHNYLSVAPVLVFMIFRQRGGFARRGLCAGALCIALAVVPKWVEHLPNVRQMPYSFGHLLLNQYLGTVHPLSRDSAEWAKESAVASAEWGDGRLERMLSEYRCADYYTYFGKYDLITNEELVEHTPFILKSILRTALQYPRAAFSHKWCWTLAFLNLDKLRYGDLVYLEHNRFGLTLDPKLPRFLDTMNWYLEIHEGGFWYQTGIFFLVSLAVGAAAFWLGYYPIALTAAFSLFHVAGYFITDVCGLWRYLLPNYILSFAIIGAFALKLLENARRASAPSTPPDRED